MEIRMRDLDEADVDGLQFLLESDAGYTERITGYPPGPSDALSTLIGRPSGLEPDDKWEVGLWDGDELVAFADVLLGYPGPRVAFIGLLIVRGDRRGRGIGRMLHDRLVERLRSGGTTRIRLGIVATNAEVADPFWAALGYRPTGEVKPYRYDKLQSTVALWELSIAASGSRTPSGQGDTDQAHHSADDRE